MKKPEKNEVMKTEQTDIEEIVIKDMNFVVEVDGEERAQKTNVLNKKINALNKRYELLIADNKDHWKLNQLINRRSQMEAVWITTNHIIVKSGSILKYASKKTKDISKEKFDYINIDFGTEVWIQDIFETGIDDLIQIFLINDYTKRIYAITWNLRFNREHSNF